MRLRTFFVKSYRSIVEAQLDNIHNYCVIVGPNNVGKSNLLKAMILSLSIVIEGVFSPASYRRKQYSLTYKGEGYDWKRDIPNSLSDDENASTVFKLTFEFNEQEKADFKEEFGINLSKSLQLKFQFFRDHAEYNIIMPGRAKKPMEAKMREIGLFIRKKLDFQYIPCDRSTEFTEKYYFDLLRRELISLEDNPEYIQCIQKIESLQKPIIEALENKLTNSLQAFLPDIRKVDLQKSFSYIDTGYRLSRAPSRLYETPIFIDDGNNTSIDNKGDGVKSLVAIGLVESISFERAKDKSLILCIEEPEAHLHPDAIHGLRTIFEEIASKNNVQVIISTHSPILVDRNNYSNNVIVLNNHRVKSCNLLSEIRDLLGIRTTDSMGASKVVLVEGECDKRFFTRICKELSDEVRKQLESGELEFVAAGSATKMDYYIKLYNSFAVSTIVILDNDDCGSDEARSLLKHKLKNSSEILLIKGKGMKTAELEDLVDFDAYKDELLTRFGIDINQDCFKKRKDCWSNRLKKAADNSAVFYDEDVETQIKIMITEIVEEKGMDAIFSHEKSFLESMVHTIERYATGSTTASV